VDPHFTQAKFQQKLKLCLNLNNNKNPLQAQIVTSGICNLGLPSQHLSIAYEHIWSGLLVSNGHKFE
jgi:hypothetical protein